MVLTAMNLQGTQSLLLVLTPSTDFITGRKNYIHFIFLYSCFETILSTSYEPFNPIQVTITGHLHSVMNLYIESYNLVITLYIHIHTRVLMACGDYVDFIGILMLIRVYLGVLFVIQFSIYQQSVIFYYVYSFNVFGS